MAPVILSTPQRSVLLTYLFTVKVTKRTFCIDVTFTVNHTLACVVRTTGRAGESLLKSLKFDPR